MNLLCLSLGVGVGYEGRQARPPSKSAARKNRTPYPALLRSRRRPVSESTFRQTAPANQLAGIIAYGILDLMITDSYALVGWDTSCGLGCDNAGVGFDRGAPFQRSVKPHSRVWRMLSHKQIPPQKSRNESSSSSDRQRSQNGCDSRVRVTAEPSLRSISCGHTRRIGGQRYTTTEASPCTRRSTRRTAAAISGFAEVASTGFKLPREGRGTIADPHGPSAAAVSTDSHQRV